jgi:hypothetical protein
MVVGLKKDVDFLRKPPTFLIKGGDVAENLKAVRGCDMMGPNPLQMSACSDRLRGFCRHVDVSIAMSILSPLLSWPFNDGIHLLHMPATYSTKCNPALIAVDLSSIIQIIQRRDEFLINQPEFNLD